MKLIPSLIAITFLAGCSMFEDAATSLASDIERSANQLGSSEGSTTVVTHDAKARAPANARVISVQFDKVGALIVWYKDSTGSVIESGSTSYHARFVDTPETITVDKSIDTPLKVELQRRNGRAIITKVF